jgi:hypothetical protein
MYVGDNLNYCGPWMTPLAGDTVNSNFSGVLVTSDFGPELDRLKRWKSLRLLSRGDTGAPTVDASVDGGATWTSCPLLETESAGSAAFRTFDLSGIASSRMVRFRVSLVRNNSATSFAELAAFSASFELVDSDDVHPDGRDKLAWTFAIAGVETVELGDGSAVAQRLGELRTQLWTWARARTELSLIDTDGETYTVKIDTMRETQPIILPPADFVDPLGLDDDSGREAFYAVTLIEV